jgi:hypothetical protein
MRIERVGNAVSMGETRNAYNILVRGLLRRYHLEETHKRF